MKKIILLVSFLFIAFFGYSQDTTTIYYKLKTLEINKVEVFKLNNEYEYDFWCDLGEDEIETLKTVLLYNDCNYMKKPHISCPHIPVIQFKISNFIISISKCDEVWDVYENGKLVLRERYCRPEDIEAFIKSL